MCDVCGDAQHEPRVSRRHFLMAGALAALGPWSIGLAIAADPPAPGAPPPANAIAPADALKRLMDGNARYAANTPNERDFSSGRAARVKGQYPIAQILSCSDSRVAPELAFDQGPGDIFVMRVAGGIVARFGVWRTLANDLGRADTLGRREIADVDDSGRVDPRVNVRMSLLQSKRSGEH